MPPKPGSCTLRLTPLPSLSPSQKTALISSISTDITATLIYVAKAAGAGLLEPAHTEPLGAVIEMIRGAAGSGSGSGSVSVSQREKKLEGRVGRYRRRLRWCRRRRPSGEREMGRVRKEFGDVMGRMRVVLGDCVGDCGYGESEVAE